MRSSGGHRLLVAALIGGLAFTLVPMTGSAATATWLDEITELVKHHQEMARFEGRERAYDPYLEQLKIVKLAYDQGNARWAHEAMNRLMDMLQHDPQGPGLPTWSAGVTFPQKSKISFGVTI